MRASPVIMLGIYVLDKAKVTVRFHLMNILMFLFLMKTNVTEKKKRNIIMFQTRQKHCLKLSQYFVYRVCIGK